MLRTVRVAMQAGGRTQQQAVAFARGPAARWNCNPQRLQTLPRRYLSSGTTPPTSSTAAEVTLPVRAPVVVTAPKPRRSWLRMGLFAAGGVVALSAAGLVYVNSKLEPSDPLRPHAGNLSTFTNALVRFWRDLYCATRIVLDYKMTLQDLEGEELVRARKEVHLRSAIRLRNLMRVNAGVYIKFGQTHTHM